MHKSKVSGNFYLSAMDRMCYSEDTTNLYQRGWQMVSVGQSIVVIISSRFHPRLLLMHSNFVPGASLFSLLAFCCFTNQHSWLANSYCFSADFAFLQSRWVPWGWGSLLSLLPFSQLQAASLWFHTTQRQPWSNRHRAQPPKLRC